MTYLKPGAFDRSLLIVDNDEGVRLAVTDHFSSRGITVSHAENCEIALALLQNQSFDLILTGILIPEMGGIELARRIKNYMPEQAVIIMTSSTDVKSSIEAMRLKVNDYILKPVDLDELETRVALVFMKSETRKRDRSHQFQLVEKVLEQEKKLEDNFLQAVRSLIHAIEARDRYTKGHSFRVTRLVEALLRQLDLEAGILSDVVLASQLHDTGKLGISDTILRKTSGLSHEEFFIMRTHPEVGYHILKPILPEPCLEGILHHHERWDGKGYPMNLIEEQIPLGARIISIADSFDAMVTDRTYRHALSISAALKEIEKGSGRQFDPDIVPAFIDIVSKNRFPAMYAEQARGGRQGLKF
jgi:response regulator RpfG family c-di-GMP phosphodiesterase